MDRNTQEMIYRLDALEVMMRVNLRDIQKLKAIAKKIPDPKPSEYANMSEAEKQGFTLTLEPLDMDPYPPPCFYCGVNDQCTSCQRKEECKETKCYDCCVRDFCVDSK